MGESLVQALQLTGIGMGMTFAAIGVLVLGMLLMTSLIKDRPTDEQGVIEREPAAEPQRAEEPVVSQTSRTRYKAAAAAVAVALSQGPEAGIARDLPLAAEAGWSCSVRAQHLARRQYYDLKRSRR